LIVADSDADADADPGVIDPAHWLHRLSAADWLAAAETELGHCREALVRRAVRPGVTHARRAAGMALNALLRRRSDSRYGRSYMEHVVALAGDAGAPAEARAAAELLRAIAPVPPALVRIGKPDLAALEAARAIVEYARAQLSENG
jgi:HEPN domain-containing protein